MENIIDNIKYGAHYGSIKDKSGYELARHIADEYTKKTGLQCHVRRVLDYTDRYNDNDRHHYSFDIVEISSTIYP